ncbi:hypothetical protein C2845_PM14G06530 [Panicum miliaceum]|uniref:Uncharacterized protein n=1 Tax=Panicum miliaceum TaxID=4540 RepID=A0A3L6PQW4_PANMI|nr:hypothetical protein C2845_PM14G06530 [Panicum miliaceum]
MEDWTEIVVFRSFYEKGFSLPVVRGSLLPNLGITAHFNLWRALYRLKGQQFNDR